MAYRHPGPFQMTVRSPDCHGIEIAIDLPEVGVFADPLLKKVFYNLVENSVRHGEKLTRILISSAGNPRGLSIIFEDDGVGVAENVKEKIFRRKHFKNTGFGLFLSREILGITSIAICENGIPGQGARFEIRVPGGAWRCGGQENPLHDTAKRSAAGRPAVMMGWICSAASAGKLRETSELYTMKYTARHIRRFLEQGRIDPDLWKAHFPSLLDSCVPECSDCGDYKSNLCPGGKDPVDCFLGVQRDPETGKSKKSQGSRLKQWDGAGAGKIRPKGANKVFDQSKM
jgi:hypothetical protein